jgi:SulP family sulfate permease
VATLLVGVLAGVVVGIALSPLWLIAVTTRPHLAQLGRRQGTMAYRDIAAHPDDELVQGIVLLRVDSGLFFATADAVEDRARELILERTDLTGFVLDCEGMNMIDTQGTAEVAAIARLTQEAGLELRLARVKTAVAAVLDRDGVLDQLGPDHLHSSVD